MRLMIGRKVRRLHCGDVSARGWRSSYANAGINVFIRCPNNRSARRARGFECINKLGRVSTRWKLLHRAWYIKPYELSVCRRKISAYGARVSRAVTF